jgi:hypothetical protein
MTAGLYLFQTGIPGGSLPVAHWLVFPRTAAPLRPGVMSGRRTGIRTRRQGRPSKPGPAPPRGARQGQRGAGRVVPVMSAGECLRRDGACVRID